MGVADYITKLEKQNEYFKKQLRTKIQDKIELKKENEKLKEKNEELEEKVDEANKIMEEYKELKEFKEKAEEECEASAVMEDMMNRIKEAEEKESMWYSSYKNQEPTMKAIRNENELLVEYFIEEYDLNTADTIRGDSWNNRMRLFCNRVMSKMSGVSWWEFFDNYDIAYESWDSIRDYYNEDEEVRIKYCKESLGLNEDDEDYNKIVNEEENDFDWDEQEEDFMTWYIEDYCGGQDSWCDYDGNYWYIK